jgi:hypothetical protein
MTQQAELFKRIDTLPPKYFGEIIDFVGYLEHKARQAAASSKKVELTEEQIKRERECFRLHADELNREAMDVLSYQWPGFNEEKLQQLIAINRQAAELNQEMEDIPLERDTKL